LSTIRAIRRSLGLLLCTLSVSCLPEEDRPPAGRLLVTVSGDDALESGLMSDDGWNISYDRFLVSLGNLEMRQPSGDDSDESCTRYTDESTSYLRLLDLKQPGPQTVATAFALGECAPAFHVEPSFDDTVLGAGVDASDLAFMRNEEGGGAGPNGQTVIYVSGQATRDGGTMRFQWAFRQMLGYVGCDFVTLRANETLTMDIRMRSAGLFQGGTDEGLLFQPYAAADGDGDGDVSLEELASVSRSSSDGFRSLGDLLSRGLVPRLPSVHDTTCRADVLGAPPPPPQR
jgi:hypothetical protein